MDSSCRGEAAAAEDGDAEAGEEIAGDHVAFGQLRHAADADAELAAGEKADGHEVAEGAVGRTQGVIDGVGEGFVGVDGAGAVRGAGGVEVDDALGIGDGERTQEDGVHDAEDSGVGADAQRQGQRRR